MVWLIAAIVVIVGAALLLVGTHFMPRSWKLARFTRPLSLILIVLMSFRFLWDHTALGDVIGLVENSPFGTDAFSTAVAVLLVWFTYAAVFTIVLNEFYDFKALSHVVYYFSVPVLLLDLAFFEVYAIGNVGVDGYSLSNFMVWIIIIEIMLGLSIALSHVVRDRKYPVPTRSELPNSIFAIIGAVLAFIPAYFPQAMFGYIDQYIKFLDMSEEHRFVVYLGVLIPFVIYHFLKNKTPEAKRFALLYLSYGGLWTFMSANTLLEWIEPRHWPLHLCNLAMLVVAIAIAFKWDKLFYFTLFINVLGAVLAMVLPDYSEARNSFSDHVIYFWYNHYMAFFMPILLVALGVFKRPKFKEWIYAQIGFAVYFVVVLVMNASLDAVHGPGTADFFFINSDFIAEKLGEWAEHLRDITATVQIGEYTLLFYPVYQVLYYLGFVAVSAAMWFLYAILFTTWDEAQDRRERERAYKDMRKKLKEFLGGRTIAEPIGGDDSPRIVLREFSKRYGANKHYSVDHASFEVNGGEIFGFLGPNGAGKSTIIKSMVGIQTITSGNIELCGYDVELQPVQAKQNIGFVPDHYALYENLTGREYINYIADLYEVSVEERDAFLEKYVERFQLVGSFDNQMKTYSHGMKQKIAIMAALVHNPKVWILDEPLTGLDPTSIHEVKECMKEHAAAGNIVFFSSHIIDVVEKLCDRIAVIKKGKIRACTSMQELADRGIELEQFYLDIVYADEAETEAERAAVSEPQEEAVKA